MSMLKRLWTQIVRFAKALEGIDDPAGVPKCPQLPTAAEHPSQLR